MGQAPPRPRPEPSPHWLLAAGLGVAGAAVPLAWSDAFAAEYSLPKLLTLTAGLLLSSTGLVLSKNSPRRTALDHALLFCAVALGMSLFNSLDPRLSFWGRYDSYAYGVWPLGLLILAYYLAAWGLEGSRLRRVLRACLCAAAIAAAYGALQSLGWEIFATRGALPAGGRAVSTLGSPVFLGAYLALVLPLALHWALEGGRERPLGWACLLAIAAGIFATLSRAAWLAGAFGCVCYLPLSGRWRLRRPGRAGALALAAIVAAGVIGAARLVSHRKSRASDRGRVQVWETAAGLLRENPWTGLGPDSFEQGFRRLKPESYARWEYQAHAHNDILQALSTTGLVGTLAYLSLLATLAVASWKALEDPERRPLAAALGSGLLALFIVMKFDPVPLEALALAALFAGALCPVSAGGSRGGAGLVAACLALIAAGASTAAAARLAAADRLLKLAQVQVTSGRPELAYFSFKRALSLDSCELSYRVKFANYLADRAANPANTAVRGELLEEAADAGREAVACHPHDMLSHYLYGFASLRQAEYGARDRLAAAERELDAALRLDPNLPSLMEIRIEAAALRGDEALKGELTRRMERQRALQRP